MPKADESAQDWLPQPAMLEWILPAGVLKLFVEVRGDCISKCIGIEKAQNDFKSRKRVPVIHTLFYQNELNLTRSL